MLRFALAIFVAFNLCRAQNFNADTAAPQWPQQQQTQQFQNYPPPQQSQQQQPVQYGYNNVETIVVQDERPEQPEIVAVWETRVEEATVWKNQNVTQVKAFQTKGTTKSRKVHFKHRLIDLGALAGKWTGRSGNLLAKLVNAGHLSPPLVRGHYRTKRQAEMPGGATVPTGGAGHKPSKSSIAAALSNYSPTPLHLFSVRSGHYTEEDWQRHRDGSQGRGQIL